MEYRIETRESAAKPAQQTSLLQDILALLLKVSIILAALALLFTFLFGITAAKDITMKPAVQDGDLVIFYRMKKDYVASDVLVLEYENIKQVRRVVAIAGDTVDITEEGLYINGYLIAEQSTQELYLYEGGATFPITLGDGQVFVLGDNRSGTIDSRMYGAINTQDTLGKVITIIRQRNI